jgi:uncharacterized repeat protein (TIGR01451 family)
VSYPTRRTVASAAAFSVIATSIVAIVLTADVARAALAPLPDDTWGANDRVTAIQRAGGLVFLGGEFSALTTDTGSDTLGTANLGALDASTGEPLRSFDPEVNGKVLALALSPDGDTLWVGGNFTTIAGQPRKKLAAFDLRTSPPRLSAWKPALAPNNVVRAIQQVGSTLYVGGGFTSVGSTPRQYLAAFGADSGALKAWSPSPDNLVRDLSVQGTRVYIAGNFQNVNGSSQSSLAAVRADTGATVDGVYHPRYPVLDLAWANGILYGAGGGAGGRALAVDIATGQRYWERKGDGNLQAVDAFGDYVYFGGHMLEYDGTPVEFMVRVDPTTGVLDRSWLPSVKLALGVFAVHGSGAKLYLGGDFLSVTDMRTGTKVRQPHFAQFTDDRIKGDADLSLRLTDGPDPVAVGKTVKYVATVRNAGPDLATGVTVTDRLPSGLSFAAASANCNYDRGDRTVTCTLPNLPVGGTGTATIWASPGTVGTQKNTVRVASHEIDPDTSNDVRTAVTTVTSRSGGDLNVKIGDTPDPVLVGRRVTYEVRVANQGPDASSGVRLEVALPDPLAFVKAVPSKGTCSGGRPVVCRLGTIGAKKAATVDVVATAPRDPMTVSVRARVSSLSPDPDRNDNARTAFTTVRVASADTARPKVADMEMRDIDADGLIDRVVVRFSEDLAVCPANCDLGWDLRNVPSDGHLRSVSVTGDTATLQIEESADPTVPLDTAVGGLTVALGPVNAIQDRAGNHATFAARAPSDGAGPVPVAFRKKNAAGGTLGRIEPGDELATEWSEPLVPASIPGTTTVTITDPSGGGNDVMTANGFLGGPMNLGAGGYVNADGASASFGNSKLQWVAAQQALVLTIGGSCGGGGCGSLGTEGSVTVVYTAPDGAEDAAGNPAVGSFTKTMSLF